MAPADLKDDIPGISGTRALNDNLSDMKAQVASNFKGIGLVTALIEEYTLEVVQAYMNHIQVRPILNLVVCLCRLFIIGPLSWLALGHHWPLVIIGL